MQKDLRDHLMEMISPNRQELFLELVDKRTKKIAMVLEDIFQSHNAAAVLRSCDCFGIQDVHIIENRNQFKPHKDIELGSSKWLNISRYGEKEQNTEDCLKELKANGYAIAATTPHTHMTIDELPTDQPIALVLGTEKQGISQTVIDHADHLVRIPMYGFTESFNISVAAAVSLHSLRSKFIRDSQDLSMTEAEKIEVLIGWCRNTIKRGNKVIEEYNRRSQDN
ncbi:RNA methyltransferase [Cryomorphaceae bacterium 1068]|nr:RNA methyltransferase [Cryomorphaceae bacterium 1068]